MAEKDDGGIDDLLAEIEGNESSSKKEAQKAPAKKKTAKKKASKKSSPVLVQNVEIRKVKFNENNREAYEQEVNELACSIEASGFIMPIVVNKKKEVLDGERRARACLQLGMDTIPCIVSDSTFDEATILANYVRTNLSEEELKSIFTRMHKTEGLTQQEIANRIGVSQGRVSQVLSRKKRGGKKRGRAKAKRVRKVSLPENVQLKVGSNRTELTFILDDEMVKNPLKSISTLFKEIKDLPGLIKEARKK